ncbi:MAG: hypothetical protein FJ147_03635 [Deltaproteobacteria bacterium]|nr:hypothetical protein [Deltaproteobacteria bacterium]
MKKQRPAKNSANARKPQTHDPQLNPPLPASEPIVKMLDDLVDIGRRLSAKAAAGRPPYQPPPGKARLLSVFTLLSPVGGVTVQNLPSLFSEGCCSECLTPRGQRTKRVMEVTYSSAVSRRCDGALAQLDMSRGPTFHVFSKDFLSLLTTQEHRLFRWRKVKVRNPTKITKEMFELIHSAYLVYTVALRGSNPDRDACDACGATIQPYYPLVGGLPEWLNPIGDAVRRDQPDYYVSAADLPEPVPPCFTIGDQRRGVQLVFTGGHWRNIKRQRGTVGINTWGVGFVDPELVEPVPTI